MFGHLSNRCMVRTSNVVQQIPSNVSSGQSSSHTNLPSNITLTDDTVVINEPATLIPGIEVPRASQSIGTSDVHFVPYDTNLVVPHSTSVSGCQVGYVQVTFSTDMNASSGNGGGNSRVLSGLLGNAISLPPPEGGQNRRKKQHVTRNEASTSTITSGYALRTSRDGIPSIPDSHG